MKFVTLACSLLFCLSSFAQENFPDGTPIPDWFRQNEIVNIETLGDKYKITDYSVVNDSTLIQTEKIQAVIDQASSKGGGVVIIPKGTYLSGALFFKPKTHLYLEEGAVLKGSDDISNFPIINTRIEGQSLKYFAALVNADRVNGFTISGKGTINGNGLRYWKSFWLRRTVIPKCTNMDELRPRLVHISNSNDVQLSGVRLINSPFWTTHIYKCNNVKLLGLYIFSPAAPVKAPSTDAIDIDVCNNVLVKNCYLSVNDDAIALKGGKGPGPGMTGDGRKELSGGIVKELDLPRRSGIPCALLSQHLDHHVVCGFIDEGDHHLLPVDLIDPIFVLFGGCLGYLPDKIRGEDLRKSVAQLFHVGLIDIAGFGGTHEGHGVGAPIYRTLL